MTRIFELITMLFYERIIIHEQIQTLNVRRFYHFSIIHGKEGVEVGNVKEDDQEGEHGTKHAEDDEKAELGDVRQCGEAELGGARREEARETGDTCYLKTTRE